jgi:hypothetical protein
LLSASLRAMATTRPRFKRTRNSGFRSRHLAASVIPYGPKTQVLAFFGHFRN